MEETTILGKPTQALGAHEILTGQAQYTADISLPGMLVGKLLYTAYPVARILKVDARAARRLPDVHAVLTAGDIPGENSYLYAYPPDQPLLVTDQARYQGDALAAVAAEDEASAQAALEAIQVDYSPLQGIFDPLQALLPGAPRVWDQRPNLADHLVIEHGDLAAGFAQAEIILEHNYNLPMIEHAFMETESALAYLDSEGVMVVYTACQSPHRDRLQIARALGFPENRVRVVQPFVGGAFGGKDEAHVQIHAALLALATRRPVKIVRSREESFQTHVKRHAVTIRYKVGARRDGRLTAVHAVATGDAGPYTNASKEVMGILAALLSGPYEVPNARLESLTVYTNNPIAGAMRGFGIPQALFACEAHMDALARALGIDPLAIRRINALRTGTRLPTGQVVRQGSGLQACLEEAGRLSGWEQRGEKERRPAPHLRRGWGLAALAFSIGMGRNVPDHAGATLQMAPDGSVLLLTGAGDMGQGSHTALAQLAAEALGVSLAAVRVVRPDTEKSFDAGPTAASRQTFVSGNAVLRAAQPIRQALLDTAAEETGLPAGLLALRGGWLYAEGERLSLTVAGLAAKAAERNRRLHADGFYSMEYPDELLPGSYPYAPGVYAFGAQVAQVLVDIETGQVTVEDLVAVHDPGRVVNPGGARGQVQGGVAMALGYALMEELLVQDGRTLNNDFVSYLIPTARDLPNVRVGLVEIPEPYAPYGAKGLGEPPVAITAPAILNAVVDAIGAPAGAPVGAPICELPLTPERVLAAINLEKMVEIANQLKESDLRAKELYSQCRRELEERL
jgi:CO/xanthine dehydrogenase Mo-binding subunit